MAAIDIMDVPAPLKWQVPQEGWDYMDVFAAFPNPVRKNAELVGGYSGFGIIYENLPYLWHSLVFAVLWFCARNLSKKHIFPPLARALGIKASKKAKISKFGYNMWLLIFYASSSAFGWFYALDGEDFFAFPPTKASSMALWNYHPVDIKPKIHWYYMYQLGFYLAELYAIFVEIKRTDFLEYVIHHVVTIYLILVSYMVHEHRIGAVIIFIHDVPDIFLCVTKLFYYTGNDTLSTVAFAMFTGSFIFFRLYVFPLLTYSIFCLAPQFHPATWGYWSLAFFLSFLLQGLQVFWFVMILKLIARLIATKGDNTGDPRSDSEDEGVVSTKESREAKSKKAKKAE